MDMVLWTALLALAPALAEDAPAADRALAPAMSDPAAERLIQLAVEAHGLADPHLLEIRFGFRGVPYRLVLDGRQASYERVVDTDAGPRTDRLRGADFASVLDGAPMGLDPVLAGRLRRSLNSVAYFALLPRPLQDPAVIATHRGPTELAGQMWDTLDVRFRREGGGEDHDDVYRYWFDPQTHRIAFLAYTFHTGDGGVRLRRVIRPHQVGVVVLLDYANHGRDGTASIDDAVRDFEAGRLPLLSTIELTDVAVAPADHLP